MPPYNIPPKVRFYIYIGVAVALIFVDYLQEKHWVGGPEVRLMSRIAALGSLLAAAKTDTSAPAPTVETTATVLVPRPDQAKRPPPEPDGL